MFTISLHNHKVFAKIGLYPEELILGNEFAVDVEIQVSHFSEKEFVDYTILSSIIKQSFAKELHTLEALCIEIHTSSLLQFPFAQNIKVTVRKLNPPMPAAIDYAAVSYQA